MDWPLVGSIVGTLAALAAVGMAAFVYVVAPSRMQNRLTALFLALTGVQVFFTFGFMYLLEERQGPSEAVAITSSTAQSIVYLALLGTLDSPLARAFGSARARFALSALAGAAVASWPFYRGLILDASGLPTAGYWSLLFAHALALLYGVIVAVSAWRRAAPGSAARARGRAFAFAFGVRDVVFVVFITVAVLIIAFGVPEDVGWTVGWTWLQDIVVPVSVLAMVLLMGYGMAKAQLFEVDLTIKRGVRRGTVAGAFLVVFLVVSQLIEGFSSQAFGIVGGALASGLLLFALAPLQRTAERISGAVVPDARPLAERTREERAGLYREQVRIAWEDGKMGLKERRMLDAARDRLGLAPDVAIALESEVTAPRGSA